ncbi:MAG TPA: DUF1295 domain-containing protein [bacterium]|nr:DUF1295 domain-containing protein [bacterium]
MGDVVKGRAELYLLTAGVLLLIMLALWRVSLGRRDASIVDPFWGTGFVIVAWVAAAAVPGAFARRAMLLAMVSIWGLRLSWHLLRRNLGHGEDYRYQAMRAQHGDRFAWVSLFTVFLLQGVLLWIISMPLQAALSAAEPASLGVLDFVGAGAWFAGFLFEAVGDAQLKAFKADPASKGKVLDTGLWRYTRHPNYFGDALQWWGFFLVAGATGAWWTVFSPLVMTVLLRRVSGVTLLEKSIVDRRPGYREYIARTNAFVPWLPRKR